MAPDDVEANWSYSKSQLFASCPRALYFALPKVGKDLEDRLPKREAVTVWALAGVAVHRAIAKQMDAWAANLPLDFRQAQTEAEAWLGYVWANSGRLIMEAANGQQLDSQTRGRLTAMAKANLRVFQQRVWPRFNGHHHLLHEELRTFQIAGCPVAVKVDLCTRAPSGDIVISDWKTGHLPVLGAGVLQLNAYALWAMKEYDAPREKIVVQLVNLKTGEIVQKKPDLRSISEAEDQIQRESTLWQERSIDKFPVQPAREKCFGCRFLTICTPGQTETGRAITLR